MAEMKFWFGMNNLSPNAFKGAPRKTRGGLMFRGSYYDKAFVSIRKGRKVYMQRESDQRLPVTKLTIPIPDDIVVKIEDEVLERMPEIFLRHFETDLRGRASSSRWQSFFERQGNGGATGAGRSIMNSTKTPRGAATRTISYDL